MRAPAPPEIPATRSFMMSLTAIVATLLIAETHVVGSRGVATHAPWLGALVTGFDALAYYLYMTALVCVLGECLAVLYAPQLEAAIWPSVLFLATGLVCFLVAKGFATPASALGQQKAPGETTAGDRAILLAAQALPQAVCYIGLIAYALVLAGRARAHRRPS